MTKHTRHGAIKMGLAALLLAGTGQAACVADPGTCCETVDCDPGNGWANLETSVPSGGPVVAVSTPYTVQNVTLGRMRRLGIPADAPAQPEHLAYFEPANRGTGGNGAPFAGTTVFGSIAGRVGGFRWYAVSALKNPAGLPPDAATALHEYGCYSLTNTGSGSVNATWTDQFGAQSGTFGFRPSTLCVPANGTGGKAFVCYGDSDNVGPGPGVVGVDTPWTVPVEIETDRYDEFCAVVQ
jgi:hypothetical protein